ncbi:uncharacterized protein N7496_007426 [Penicillium cataractarum]|uniref:Lipocalin-like domain-containing protein n=1 Tax=Penicillium cataractarum TaxID=2100454 RepID=A0A9W9V8C4_9EURO|nr:uncharacterized protein N7496_007426 [Penicillium cataractarum]KAJ5371334.1 hypothetical protein N7496_007426 [Penicillium cataractarum]
MSSTFENVKTQLAGVWSLETISFFMSPSLDGSPVAVLEGDKILGRAVFTAGGYMNGTVTFDHCDPASLSSAAWDKLTSEEITRICRVMSSYSGPWSLVEEGNDILLKILVEIALNPCWEGSPQVRRQVKIEEVNGESLLTLVPMDEITLQPGKVAYSKLVWKKIGPP